MWFSNRFLILCWWLNRLHLSSVPAVVRWIVFVALRSRIVELAYEPETRQTSGYASSLALSKGFVLAFRRADGTLQFRW
jgi:hypothetical protein